MDHRSDLSTPLRAVLAYVERRPQRPVKYMALALAQDIDEMQIRLDVLTRLGLLVEEPACCGRGVRYVVAGSRSEV